MLEITTISSNLPIHRGYKPLLLVKLLRLVVKPLLLGAAGP